MIKSSVYDTQNGHVIPRLFGQSNTAYFVEQQASNDSVTWWSTKYQALMPNSVFGDTKVEVVSDGVGLCPVELFTAFSVSRYARLVGYNEAEEAAIREAARIARERQEAEEEAEAEQCRRDAADEAYSQSRRWDSEEVSE